MDTLNPIQGIKAPALPNWPRGQGAQVSPEVAHTAGDPSAEGVIRLAAQAQVVAPPTRGEEANESDRERGPGQQQVEDAVKNVNEFLQMVRRSVQFKLDEDTGRMVVQVRDEETNEVIRQIPREEVLKIAKELDRLKGLLFEVKV